MLTFLVYTSLIGGGGWGHGGFKFAVSVLYRDKYLFRGEGAVSGLVFILINRGNERATTLKTSVLRLMGMRSLM